MNNLVRLLIALCSLALIAGSLASPGAPPAAAYDAAAPAAHEALPGLQGATPTATAAPSPEATPIPADAGTTPTAVATAVPAAPAATIVAPLVLTTTTNPDDETVFTLPRFGLNERVMHGPYDWAGFYFNLPAHWELMEGGQIELDLLTTFSGPASTTGLPAYIGTLDVAYDGRLLATVALDRVGGSTVIVPIPTGPAAAQAPYGAPRPGTGNEHMWSLTLNAPYECDAGVGAHTTVAVQTTSRLVLPHRLISPSTDLRQLPYPITQDSLAPDVAVLVVSDAPTAAELQAAMTVAAGLGHMSNGRLQLSFVPVAGLTPELRAAAHLILVGKDDSLPLLNNIQLPARQVEDLASAPADGVLQLAISPWNPARVVLVIGGSTDEGVVKAGQALSARSILVSGRPDLAVVSQVEPQRVIPATAPVDRSLADMGYTQYTMTNLGANVIDYLFDVQPGQASTSGAYFDLTYNHSGFLDYSQSGLGVSINDQPVGGLALTAETAAGRTSRIVIPRSALREGRNTLRIEAFLEPPTACAPLYVNNVYFTIQTDSSLHLPFGEARAPLLPIYDLGKYPYPFLDSPVLLAQTAFVVAVDDPAGWGVAAQLAFNLGRQGNRGMAAPALYFADNVPDDARPARNLLLMGRPDRLPFLVQQLKDALPAAIDPATNLPLPQNNLRVDYVLRSGTSLGFLQVFPSPWNPERAVLTVLGSTDEGVSWAAAALTTELKSQLTGNLAVVSGNQVVASYIPPPIVPGGPAPAATEAAAAGPAPEAGTPGVMPGTGRPGWILPAVFLITGLMIVVLLVAAIFGLRQRSRPGA